MLCNLPGYTRWPKKWPTEIPLHLRWPVLHTDRWAWPYNYLISQRSPPGVLQPPEIEYSVGSFDRFQFNFWQWDSVPSIIGPGTQCRMFINIEFDGNVPVAFIWDLGFEDPGFSDWQTLPIRRGFTENLSSGLPAYMLKPSFDVFNRRAPFQEFESFWGWDSTDREEWPD